MACFPKIDQPCPLGIDEQRRLDGWCARCEKTVHALDGMSEEQRRLLLRRAKGPICVSYRVPAMRPLGAGFGAALAVTMSASALAIDVMPTGARSDPAQSHAGNPNTILTGSGVSGPECDEAGAVANEEFQPIDTVTITGGVLSPDSAEWVDDSDLPDLPMLNAQASSAPNP